MSTLRCTHCFLCSRCNSHVAAHTPPHLTPPPSRINPRLFIGEWEVLFCLILLAFSLSRLWRCTFYPFPPFAVIRTKEITREMTKGTPFIPYPSAAVPSASASRSSSATGAPTPTPDFRRCLPLPAAVPAFPRPFFSLSFNHYSHATYLDHEEIMYSPFPVCCPRSGGTLQARLCPPPGHNSIECRAPDLAEDVWPT